MKYYLILLAFLTTSFTATGQTYTGDEKEIETILSLVAGFSEAVMAGDAVAIANAYTEDAKIFPTDVDIISGREAVQKYWTPGEGYRTSYHKITPSEIKIMGDEAYDFGYYEGTTTLDNGEMRSWRGKYVIVWKKIDGEWKIYLDIWNSIK
ncbi:MAG: DUF4440 domain-containing protein [Bacteroidota bacterium]